MRIRDRVFAYSMLFCLAFSLIFSSASEADQQKLFSLLDTRK